MQRHRITNMSCVPQVLQLFRDGIEREIRKQGKQQHVRAHCMAWPGGCRWPLGACCSVRCTQRLGGSFEFFASGGAYLDPDLALWWEALGVKVVQGYGMTEAAPIVACHWVNKRNARSVGKPVPGVDMRIAEDGEVLVRGDNLSPGYWQNPAATAEAFVDGWYHTGDLGTLDAERLAVSARPQEEHHRAGQRHECLPRGRRARVAGGHARQGRRRAGAVTRDKDIEVHAVLLLAKGAEADGAEIVRGANQHLAPHQQIRRHTVWPEDSFPLTPTLKVKRGRRRRASGADARPGRCTAQSLGSLVIPGPAGVVVRRGRGRAAVAGRAAGES